MNKVDVTFVFRGNNESGYARVKKDGSYSNEGYLINDLINFIINGIDKQTIKKGSKIDFGKNKKVIYEFHYRDLEMDNETSEKIAIVIPGRYRQQYKLEENTLDALVRLKKKLNRYSLIKTSAALAAGITLMTFASIKIAQLDKQENDSRNEYIKEQYIDKIVTPITDEEKKEAIINDLKERAEKGDSQAIVEYNYYLQQQSNDKGPIIK